MCCYRTVTTACGLEDKGTDRIHDDDSVTVSHRDSLGQRISIQPSREIIPVRTWFSCSLCRSEKHVTRQCEKKLLKLLVDIMLCAGLDTTRLHAENGLICSNASQEGARTEALPIAATLSYATYIHHWTKNNFDPFADMFLPHRHATGAE